MWVRIPPSVVFMENKMKPKFNIGDRVSLDGHAEIAETDELLVGTITSRRWDHFTWLYNLKWDASGDRLYTDFAGRELHLYTHEDFEDKIKDRMF